MPHAAMFLISSLLLGAGPAEVSLPDHAATQADYEASLVDSVSTERLRSMHELLSAEPHRAGTPGDARVIAELTRYFSDLGLEVEVHEFEAYLAEPGPALVELVAPVRRTLPTREAVLDADPASQHPDHDPGWNAYSGTGDVTAGVVYVNRGTKEDFATLAAMGVSLEGKIAVARYGGNFRGYKAKYAEEAGASGLLIYTDPGDAGYARGPMWPEGPWYNPTTIQRGSILTLDYPGDPLTPGVAAVDGAARLNPRDVPFPTIPVQPIGWGAASEILSRLDGPAVPDESWQGALPFTYRLTGSDVRVRLAVEQTRKMVRTANVGATLRGAVFPEQMVLIGSHHDAWGYGAGDPLSGTIATLECARVMAEAARRGQRPARSVVFGCWGAEEYGIIGSTEWVEDHHDRLTAGAIAYLNLDAAASGLDLRASAAPSLKALIASAARSVPGAADPSGSAYDEWSRRTGTPAGELPPFGNLGGGSDHVGFYLRAGVPSAGVGAGGAPGTAYHSMNDHIGWYQRTVGDDYASARLVAQVNVVVLARLANASLLPLDLPQHGIDTLAHAEAIAKRAEQLGVSVDLEPLRRAASRYVERAAETQSSVREAVQTGRLSGARLDSVNSLLLIVERLWLDPSGLTGRPWRRHLFASDDPTSGYAAWMLPEIRRAIEDRDARAAEAAVARTAAVFRLLGDAVKSLQALSLPIQDSRDEGLK